MVRWSAAFIPFLQRVHRLRPNFCFVLLSGCLPARTAAQIVPFIGSVEVTPFLRPDRGKTKKRRGMKRAENPSPRTLQLANER